MEETSSIHNTNPAILGQQTSTSTGGTASNPAPSRTKIRKNKEKQKVCAQCGTSDTPLWRLGPQGPKSMCNACGIRWKRKNSSTNKRKKPPVPSALSIPSSGAGQGTALSPKATSPTSLNQAYPFDYPEQDQDESEVPEDGEDLEESEDAMDSPAYTPQSSPFPASPGQPSVLRHEITLDGGATTPAAEQLVSSLLPSISTPELSAEAFAAKRMKVEEGHAIPTALERDEGATPSTTGAVEQPTRTKVKSGDGSKKAKHKTTSPPPQVSGVNGSPIPVPTPRQQSLREQKEQREQRDYERAQVAEIQRALNHKYWGGINSTQSRRRTIVVTPKCDSYHSDYLDSGGSSSDGDGYGSSSGKSKNFLKVASIELEKMKTEMAYEDKLETMKHELFYLRNQIEAKDKQIQTLETSQSISQNRERELQQELEKQNQLVKQLQEQHTNNQQATQVLQKSHPTGTESTTPSSNNNGSIASSH